MNFELKAATKKPTLRSSILPSEDADDDNPSSVDIRKEALKCESEMKSATYEMLAEDPTALAYDAVYDEMKAQRKKPRTDQGPIYIPGMKRASLIKAQENALFREHAETHLHDREAAEGLPTERIYTPSFLKLQEDNRKLEAKLLAEEQSAYRRSGQKDSSALLARYLNIKSGEEKEPVIVKKQKIEEKLPEVEVAKEEDLNDGMKVDIERKQVEEVNEQKVTEKPVVTEVKKSAEEVMSARERYLQRKAAQA